MFVLGTAGHVDHGKSALIRALTGIDPDRLREEKERGMTIDLGFAWLKLPGGQEVGIVDVPGHERFIKNMLAGVGGIDLALLVVAADEGVMPQTREHLAILDLLDVRQGIVVITKKDLVDGELLDVVRLELESLLEGTSLKGSPVVAVSAVTGEGLDELLSTIEHVLQSAEPKRDLGRPRLLIDRVFAIAGSGTVVTGTLIDGFLHAGAEVEIQPTGLKTRVRALQTHKTRIDVAAPGTRVAANLANVATSEVERGNVLTSPGWLVPATRVDAKVRLLAEIKNPLRHGAVVSFFSGSDEALVRVHLLDREELEPGDTTWAQLTLFKPMVLMKGDRFIIRSPVTTLGGGQVVDPYAMRHRRFRHSVVENLKTRSEGKIEEVLVATLAINQPVTVERLAVRCNLAVSEVMQIIERLLSAKRIVIVGQQKDALLFTTEGWESFAKKAKGLVEHYHLRFPTRPGIPKGELIARLQLVPHSPALDRLFEEGILTDGGTFVCLPRYRVRLSEEQQKKIDTFLQALDENPYSPPSDIAIDGDLLSLLLEQRRVVKVAEGIIFSARAYEDAVNKVVTYVKEKGKVTVAEARDLLGTSRKYALALLEHMDERRITRRMGDVRILR